MINRMYGFLFKEIDVSIVSLFRVIFGMFMFYQIIYYFKLDYTFQFMAGPEVLFPYYGLEFIKPVSIEILKLIHFGMLLSAFLIAIGFLYRYAIIFFFLGFSYFFFIDRTLYNNHLYLIVLISFVMIFLDADKKYSIKSWRSSKNDFSVSAWQQYILTFLIAIPYIFGGISKLSSNWLDSKLVNVLLEESPGSIIHQVFSMDLLVPLVKYGGLFYDLSIVFLLLFKKTRWFAVILVLFFNIMNNSILFDDIGIFPFLMICSTILFFDAKAVGSFFDQYLNKYSPAKKEKKKRTKKRSKKVIKPKEQLLEVENSLPNSTKKHLTAACISLFVLFNILFPFRYLLYTDNPEWTGIAQRFAWRMKMQSTQITSFEIKLVDRESGKSNDVEGEGFLTKNQYMHLADDPHNFIVLARYLNQYIEEKHGFVNPHIHSKVQVEFNGAPSQIYFSPDVDLSKLSESPSADKSWILPLE